jgi:hypothetical protein
MRRALCFSLLVGLLVPAAALAEQMVPGDGTLAVRNGDGMLRLDLKGVALGRMASGVLEVEVSLERDCDGADVSVMGAEREREDVKWVDDETPVWLCRFVDRRGGLRFRISGQQVIRFKFMRNLNLSAVGRGTARIRGNGDAPGSYSLNGDDFTLLPDELESLTLGAQQRPTPVPAKRPE